MPILDGTPPFSTRSLSTRSSPFASNNVSSSTAVKPSEDIQLLILIVTASSVTLILVGIASYKVIMRRRRRLQACSYPEDSNQRDHDTLDSPDRNEKGVGDNKGTKSVQVRSWKMAELGEVKGDKMKGTTSVPVIIVSSGSSEVGVSPPESNQLKDMVLVSSELMEENHIHRTLAHGIIPIDCALKQADSPDDADPLFSPEKLAEILNMAADLKRLSSFSQDIDGTHASGFVDGNIAIKDMNSQESSILVESRYEHDTSYEGELGSFYTEAETFGIKGPDEMKAGTLENLSAILLELERLAEANVNPSIPPYVTSEDLTGSGSGSSSSSEENTSTSLPNLSCVYEEDSTLGIPLHGLFGALLEKDTFMASTSLGYEIANIRNTSTPKKESCSTFLLDEFTVHPNDTVLSSWTSSKTSSAALPTRIHQHTPGLPRSSTRTSARSPTRTTTGNTPSFLVYQDPSPPSDLIQPFEKSAIKPLGDIKTPIQANGVQQPLPLRQYRGREGLKHIRTASRTKSENVAMQATMVR